MSDEFDQSLGDRVQSSQAGMRRKQWQTPKVISSAFAATGNFLGIDELSAKQILPNPGRGPGVPVPPIAS
jgi:hypothetical protein